MNYEIVKLSDEIIDNKIDEKYLQQIFNCYRGLTDAPTLPFIKLRNIVLNLPDKHSIYVCKIDNKPVGLITLIIEQKLIHSGGLVGHIEDLCVDKDHQKKGIAEKLINYCIDVSRQNGCYKTILDCKKELVEFYKDKKFVNEGAYMCYRIVSKK